MTFSSVRPEIMTKWVAVFLAQRTVCLEAALDRLAIFHAAICRPTHHDSTFH